MEIEKLQTLILEEDELLTKINTCSSMLDGKGKAELAHLSFQIINKLIHLHKDLIKIQDNQLHTFSTVRYIFETLIHVKLLQKEPEYIFKLYYCIYDEQVKKTKNIIDRLTREVNRIAIYEELEKNEYSKLGNLSGLSETQISEKMSSLENEMILLYKKASLEFTMFFENIEFNGFKYQKSIMENNLTRLNDRLNELKKLRSNKGKELFKDQRISALFHKLTPYNFFDLIKDDRSWAEKARSVDLGDEHKQIYDYSSHFIHSLPYSLVTSFELDSFESKFTNSLILSYSYSIIEQVKTMLDIEKLFPFDVIVNIEGDN